MKRVLLASLGIGLFVTAAFAADRGDRPDGPKQNLEQKKAEILQHISERITNSQAEKVCVQAATSHDELRACREKYRPPRPSDDRQNSKGQPQQPKEY